MSTSPITVTSSPSASSVANSPSASSPPPLRIPPPTTVEIEVDPDVEHVVTEPSSSSSNHIEYYSTVPPLPKDTLALARVFKDLGAVSPTSGINTLIAHAEDPACEVSRLAESIKEGFTRRMAEINAEHHRLKEHNRAITATNQRLRANASAERRNLGRPEGFGNNSGRYPGFLIPYRGCKAVARYVQVSPADPTLVEAIMGGDTDVYTFPVFAMPYASTGDEEDNEPAAALPEW